MEDNYLKPIINKMKWRIEQEDTGTTKLAEIIKIAYDFRTSMLEDDRVLKADKQNILDFTEIMVRANHRAHQILNGIDSDVEQEVVEELNKIQIEIDKKYGYTGKNGAQQED
jgi:hypothetical protein